MQKHYVEFYFAGVLVAGIEVQEVADRNAPVNVLKGACGYRFFSRTEVTLDGELLVGECKDFSPVTYYGNEYTLCDVERILVDNPKLVTQMRESGHNRFVRIASGHFMPLCEGDVVLPPEALDVH